VKLLVNVKTKMDTKKTIEANAKLNMKMNMNAKMKPNTMLQIGMKSCRFVGHLGDQIKATGRRGPQPTTFSKASN
jgi:hypothetical protein